jgi:hypothetical protein
MVFIRLLPFVWFTFIGFDSRNGTKLLTKQTMKKMFIAFMVLVVLTFVATATTSEKLSMYCSGAAVLLGLYMGYKHEKSGNAHLF